MTRQEVLDNYKVENGIIRSPGKFEGERVYVPYFWDAFIEGNADEDDGKNLVFILTKEEIAEFPELTEDGYKLGGRLYLYQRDDGFVIQVGPPLKKEEPTPDIWAEAIAARIADEWTGKPDDPETSDLLGQVLIKALKAVPEETMKLVGTGIIESDYFDDLR